MNHARYLAPFLLFALSPQLAAQTWRDMECLPVADQVRLRNLAEQLIVDFRIREQVQEMQGATRQRSDLEPAARQCSELLRNPLSIIDLQSFECRKTVASYNILNARVRSLSEQVSSSQQMVLNQLEIERASYPRCR